jgi:vacuolar-type H+-ATPase subunit H
MRAIVRDHAVAARRFAVMTDAPETADGAEAPRARPHLEASRRVAQIMRAAEDAAHELRMEAERRADARIAEAARGAENRVAAAEEEATEIVAAAQHKAAVLHDTAESDAARIREDAQREATRVLEEARQQADEVQRIAEVFAVQTRESADTESRKQIARAREVAADVLEDGTEMTHNLRQLSDSLRKNAETLLLDVTRAHRALVARLDDAGIDEPQGTADPAAATGEIDIGVVPEFIPTRPTRRRTR